MAKYDRLISEKKRIDRLADTNDFNFSLLANDHGRTAGIYENATTILDAIDKQFESETGLKGLDVTFLFFAVALQCVRQYCLSQFENRLNDQEAANSTEGHDDEHSNRKHRYYNPTFKEIHNNPVPFDANLQTEKTKGALKGAGKLGHRLTLGHDPILGWIFGTANIATSTLTTWTFQSYHIKTGMVKRRNGKMSPADFLANHADTSKVLNYTMDKLFNQGIDGKMIVLESLRKEYVHLKSDIDTKHSLPFPMVSIISPKLANLLADYGIDMANINAVAKQFALAETINCLIAIIHGMISCAQIEAESALDISEMSYTEYDNYFHNFEEQLKLSKVRTKKIIMYSGMIASASNVVAVAVTKDIKKLDVGGIANTIFHLVTDSKAIKEIKEEFIRNNWAHIVLDSELDFEEV